ncbi:hypothetical protein [Actinomadura rubrisoli]|uniref:Uncharacterized protein n=1 Tax=Actinomadura rubrisoli TaxID=2530368 RepID=A0A4R5C8N0_9ACTN|nr:hypothetical protein [Actinomadura rubrisoli]TDD94986.1 hypothetical protein E1298_05965 [Actinomadura rubrisoli]
MTERSPGAPDPAEPSRSGDAPPPGSPPAAPAATLFADLSAVRGTDAIIEALAERRAAASTAASEPASTAGSEAARAGGAQRPADESDPAVRLLRALVTDVDEPAPGREAPEPGPAPSGPGSRRRGSRTIVALGVAGAVLASTGVAAAGGGLADHSAAQPPSAAGVAEEPDRPSSREPGEDTDVASRDRPAPARPAEPPSRPVDEPDRPATTNSGGAPGRADYERFKQRLGHLFPPQSRNRPPDGPGIPGRPGDGPEFAGPPDDNPRRLDDIRKHTRKRIDRYHRQYDPRWGRRD